MLPHYEDILSRIAEPPRWFDEQGVPRYCEFAPDRIANMHAQECALLAIECQSCGRPFVVALDETTANHNVIIFNAAWDASPLRKFSLAFQMSAHKFRI